MTSSLIRRGAAILITVAISSPCLAEDRVAVRYSSGFGDRRSVEDLAISVTRSTAGAEGDVYFDAVAKVLAESSIPQQWSAFIPIDGPTIDIAVNVHGRQYSWTLPGASTAGSLRPEAPDNPKYFQAAVQVMRLTLERAKLRLPVN